MESEKREADGGKKEYQPKKKKKGKYAKWARKMR
jgi:hypothetical protein